MKNLLTTLTILIGSCIYSNAQISIRTETHTKQIQQVEVYDSLSNFNLNYDIIANYNGSYSEIEVSKQIEWTTETIKERGLSMLKFMEERWKFKFNDWEIEKEEILFPSK